MTITNAPIDAYLSNPPQRIIDNSVTKLKDFQNLQRILGSNSPSKTDAIEHKVWSNNNIRYICDSVFSYHPLVNRFYFDRIDDEGVIYVIDIEGNEIRKDESAPTTCGNFIHKNQLSDLFPRGLTTTSCLIAIGGLPQDGSGTKTRFTNKYNAKDQYLKIGLGIAHKTPIGKLKPCISLQSVSSLFARSMANTFLRMDDLQEVFHDGTGFTQDMLDSMFDNCLGSTDRDDLIASHLGVYIEPNSESYIDTKIEKVPQTSKVFPGYVISFSRGYDRGRFINPESEVSNLGSILLSPEGQAGCFQHERGIAPANFYSRRVLISELGLNTGGFPINLVLATYGSRGILTNRTSGNNEGHIESYSARVPDYKVSFLMTDKEKEYYKVNKSIKPSFFGIELEVIMRRPSLASGLDKRQFCATTVKDIAMTPMGNHCLMKSDSSIGDIGFELVTIPATLNYHKQMFDEYFFKPGFNDRVMGAPTCGLHVHIGKQAFLPEKSNKSADKYRAIFRSRLGKFIYFMNSQENLQFIYQIAGREANLYCRPNPVASKNRHGVALGAKAGMNMQLSQGYSGFDRRSIVNTRNAETIEIRIFKSTNDRLTLYRRLEFCHALVEFVKVASLKNMNVYSFLNFVIDKDNCNKYPCLNTWLAAKKYVGITKKSSKSTGRSRRSYGPVLIEDPEAPKSKVKAATKSNPSASEQLVAEVHQHTLPNLGSALMRDIVI